MQISRYKISTKKEIKKDYKFIVVADTHGRKQKGLLDILKKEKPDFIFMPGDIFGTNLSKDSFDKYMEHPCKGEKGVFNDPTYMIELAKEMTKICPVFMSIGNHENVSWTEKDKQDCLSLGVKLLDNEYEKIGDFCVGGLSSKRGHRQSSKIEFIPDIEWLKDFEAEDGYKILLMHEPQLFPVYVEPKDIDLCLSGHTHGGQWRFLGFGAYASGQGILPHYSKGKYHDGRLFVSAGLSNTLPFPRFFNPKQLMIIELKNSF